jgi:hypothetical protein
LAEVESEVVPLMMTGNAPAFSLPETESLSVMAGLVPAIHVLLVVMPLRRGWPE